MKSETIGELTKALVSVQADLEGARKGSTNPHFRSKYADLASCWAACRSLLAANDLAVVQSFVPANEDALLLETTLLHSSGEWINSTLRMPLEKHTPQGYVAASTYARRAGLCAIVGISPADDDGETAEGRGGGASSKASRPAPGKGRPGIHKTRLIEDLGQALAERSYKNSDVIALAEKLGIGYKGGASEIQSLYKDDIKRLLDAVHKTRGPNVPLDDPLTPRERALEQVKDVPF